MLILFILFFICFWLVGMITLIRYYLLMRGMKKRIKKHFPSIILAQTNNQPISFIISLLSFGQYQKSKHALSNWINVNGIAREGDADLKEDLQKLIHQFILFQRCWILGFITIAIGLIIGHLDK